MSTGDGSILAMGTVLGHNIMGKFNHGYSLLTITRWSTVLWALISAGIASLVPGKTGYLLIVAFDIMLAGTQPPSVSHGSCIVMHSSSLLRTTSLTSLTSLTARSQVPSSRCLRRSTGSRANPPPPSPP